MASHLKATKYPTSKTPIYAREDPSPSEGLTTTTQPVEDINLSCEKKFIIFSSGKNRLASFYREATPDPDEDLQHTTQNDTSHNGL